MNDDNFESYPEDFAKEATPEVPLITTSDNVDLVFAALAKAQAEMTDPPKNKTAKIQPKNGLAYSYNYADLADILKITRPVFGKYGLALLQIPTNPFSGSVKIVTRICHGSGQWIQGVLTMPVGDDKPQTIGSAITYGRRYSAAGAAAIAPDEDEDGATAQDAASKSHESREDHAPPPGSQQTPKIDPKAIYNPDIATHKDHAAAMFRRLGIKTQAGWRHCSQWLVGENIEIQQMQNAIIFWKEANKDGAGVPI